MTHIPATTITHTLCCQVISCDNPQMYALKGWYTNQGGSVWLEAIGVLTHPRNGNPFLEGMYAVFDSARPTEIVLYVCVYK